VVSQAARQGRKGGKQKGSGGEVRRKNVRANDRKEGETNGAIGRMGKNGEWRMGMNGTAKRPAAGSPHGEGTVPSDVVSRHRGLPPRLWECLQRPTETWCKLGDNAPLPGGGSGGAPFTLSKARALVLVLLHCPVVVARIAVVLVVVAVIVVIVL